MKAGTRTAWTFVITSIALFMVVLDNLVVSTALPVIRVDLGASIEQLEWIVNAYTFTFAVFLLTGAALGDRFGRKRMFMIGLAIFTGASALAALAPVDRVAHRGTCVPGSRRRDRDAADADDPERGRLRATGAAVALGAWSGIAGLRRRDGAARRRRGRRGHLVAVGLLAQRPGRPPPAPARDAAARVARARTRRSTSPGVVARRRSGLLGIVWGLVNGNSRRLDEPADRRLARRRRAAPRGVRRVGAARRRADAADALLPRPGVLGRERRVALHVLRDVRLDLPADAVLPDRTGLLAARVRAARPALDGHADDRRPDRRCAVRPHRRRADHGAGSCAAGDRARVDRVRVGRDRRLRAPSSARSSSRGSAWACSSRPSRTSSSPRSGRTRRARRRARTTRSARSAACFGVAVLASLFARYGGYESAETFNDGLVLATWVGAAVVAGARRSPCSSRPSGAQPKSARGAHRAGRGAPSETSAGVGASGPDPSQPPWYRRRVKRAAAPVDDA